MPKLCQVLNLRLCNDLTEQPRCWGIQITTVGRNSCLVLQYRLIEQRMVMGMADRDCEATRIARSRQLGAYDADHSPSLWVKYRRTTKPRIYSIVTQNKYFVNIVIGTTCTVRYRSSANNAPLNLGCVPNRFAQSMEALSRNTQAVAPASLTSARGFPRGTEVDISARSISGAIKIRSESTNSVEPSGLRNCTDGRPSTT